jgi:hypothetical protein
MPLPGAKPKPEGQKVTRVEAVHEWTEVVDEPYRGPVPELKLSAGTAKWWAALSSMPHCILWTPSQWMFAVDTAFLHEAFEGGETKLAAEIRIREKVLGTTLDALRDLRIRYVKPAEVVSSAGDAKMADFDAARRKRLTSAE